ncbi:MAG: hypothetical protein R3B91_19870 [Planctomycetaceae bacterium]
MSKYPMTKEVRMTKLKLRQSGNSITGLTILKSEQPQPGENVIEYLKGIPVTPITKSLIDQLVRVGNEYRSELL